MPYDSDLRIRDRVEEALRRAPRSGPTQAAAVLHIIEEEKRKSYNMGYHDGARRSAPYIAHQ